MIGKVIHDGEKYVLKNEYSDLPLKPNGPNEKRLIEMVEKQGFAFVEFEVDTIAKGTSEFDVMEFKKHFPDIDIQKKNPTLLFLPDSLEN